MACAHPKNTALSNDAALDLAVLEQRKEERHQVDGSICLILDHDGADAVTGRLVDVSRSGFRAVHGSQELTPGRVIRFHYDDRDSGTRRSGWARVVWSRVQEPMVESGCYIVIAD
jgi:PilZ domain